MKVLKCNRNVSWTLALLLGIWLKLQFTHIRKEVEIIPHATVMWNKWKIFVKLVHYLAHCIPLIIIHFLLPHLTQNIFKINIKYSQYLWEGYLFLQCIVLLHFTPVSLHRNLRLYIYRCHFPCTWPYVFPFLFDGTLSWHYSHFCFKLFIKTLLPILKFFVIPSESRQSCLLQFVAACVCPIFRERSVPPAIKASPCPWACHHCLPRPQGVLSHLVSLTRGCVTPSSTSQSLHSKQNKNNRKTSLPHSYSFF